MGIILIIIFVGLIKFFSVSKKIGLELIKESEIAEKQNYQHCSFFDGKFVEVIPFQTTSFIEHPKAIRYIDIHTKEEIVKFASNQTFINLSKSSTYVRVYYSNGYIVRVFPHD